MWFASPLWLMALVPWAGVSLWLLWGRFQRTHVPYLNLWLGAMQERPKRPGLRRPPLPLLFAITSMLFAVFAAGKPEMWGSGYSGAPLQVIVDRGLTMSASSQGTYRFRDAVRLLAAEMGRRWPDLPIDLLTVPGDDARSTNSAGLAGIVDALPPTPLRSGALLDQTVARATGRGDDAVVVVSDQPIPSVTRAAHPRIIRIAPESAVEDVGISLIAARETPSPQVMVRLLNQSSQKTATLDVISANQRIRQTVQLPANGSSHDYFFSPAELGETIEATVVPGESPSAQDAPSDTRAWLARASRWPAIDSRIPLDPAVERMISVYTRKRPPIQGSATIDIVGNAEDLSSAQRGVVMAQSFADAATNGSPLAVTDHWITRGINWGELPLLPATGDPPTGWEPLVSSGTRTILAAQAEPVRKVWVGFATDQWATQTQFVIFWTNVFDWVGQGGRQFSASPLSELSKDWTPLSSPEGFPGLYQREDGVKQAFDSLAEPFPPPEASTPDWRERVAAVARQKGGRSIAGEVALAALLCLLCSLATWRKRPANSLTAAFSKT